SSSPARRMRWYSLIAALGVLALSTRSRSRTQPKRTSSPPDDAVLILIADGSSGLALVVKVGEKPPCSSTRVARSLASAMRVVVTGWLRSEERRVGKECSSGWRLEHERNAGGAG